MYAVGGDSEYGEQDSVESYTEGRGWQLEERMRLPQARSHHCSVAIDDRHLVVVGGQQNGAITAEVLGFNVRNTTGNWTELADMNTARYGHFDDDDNTARYAQ